MIRKLIAVAAFSVLLAPQANAWNDLFNSIWGMKGNETGGIIPWSPENEARAFELATNQCARWNKFPVATSIMRMPGDYIGYKCVWDPPRAVVRHRERVDAVIEK